MKLRLQACLGIELVATGCALPSQLGLGADGARALENPDAWRLLLGDHWQTHIAEQGWSPDHPWRVGGVRRREWLARPGMPADIDRPLERLAVHASRQALEAARWSADGLDVICAATSTPDRVGATLSARVASALSSDAACIDVRAGGAGGLEAWILAATLLSTGARQALVVAGEVLSPYLSRTDPRASMLMGDGASALLLQRVDGSQSGMLGACMAHASLAGRPFTVPGSLPPNLAAKDPAAFHLTACDARYAAELRDEWRRLGEELAHLVGRSGMERLHLIASCASPRQASALAQGIGIPQLARLNANAECGVLGAAACGMAVHRTRTETAESTRGFPWAGVAALGAVGGGSHRAGLIWRQGP